MSEDYTNPKNFNIAQRPSWDEYFMMTAKLAGTMGTCLKRKVGAIVVKNKRIVSTGFNGSPPGMPHCTDVGCLIVEGEGSACHRILHAEHNAMLQNSAELKGGTLYTAYLPCLNCTKTIISAGINKVVYEYDSPDKHKYRLAKEFLQEAGIGLRKIPEVNIAELVSKSLQQR